MLIKGQCLRCGQCCLYGSAIEYNLFEERVIGLRIFAFKRIDKEKINVMEPCSCLIYDIKTREAICTDYKGRSQVCKQYPYKEEELIFKGCGYKKEE